MPVSWGILSTARINDMFLAGARAAANAEVVAVASRERSRAERYAREHGIGRAHGDYDSLLADPAVEVVYISWPNSLQGRPTVCATVRARCYAGESLLFRARRSLRQRPSCKPVISDGFN